MCALQQRFARYSPALIGEKLASPLCGRQAVVTIVASGLGSRNSRLLYMSRPLTLTTLCTYTLGERALRALADSVLQQSHRQISIAKSGVPRSRPGVLQDMQDGWLPLYKVGNCSPQMFLDDSGRPPTACPHRFASRGHCPAAGPSIER